MIFAQLQMKLRAHHSSKNILRPCYLLREGQTDVSLKRFNNADKLRVDQAMNKEMEQWISNSVFTIARRIGVPIARIMQM